MDHRVIDVGTLGSPASAGLAWRELPIPERWSSWLEAASGSPTARPLQAQAFNNDVLHSRQHVLVTGPTSSGKTLVGLAVLVGALRHGMRTVLLEPMRAVAEEKADWVRSLAPSLEPLLGHPPAVTVSTGDYPLEAFDRHSSFEPGGEIIVATPERLDALMRMPRQEEWLRTIGAVCVDEAHMLSEPQRGPTIEFIASSLLAQPSPPRLVLLSASVGDVSRAAKWLEPCQLITEEVRFPPLQLRIVALGEADPDTAVESLVAEALEAEKAQIVVFVYTIATAKRLAARLEHLAPRRITAYHSMLHIDRRREIRDRLTDGALKCVVATTALASGVNFPVTHVLIRDTMFGGAGKLSVPDLLQMLGRAGRGSDSGTGIVLLRVRDQWRPDELAAQLRAPALPALSSAISASRPARHDSMIELARLALAYLVRSRNKAEAPDDIAAFFRSSLCGVSGVADVDAALEWLADERVQLARLEADGWRPTELGVRAARSMLPLRVAAGMGTVVRDLLSLPGGIELLEGWKLTDTILVLDLLFPAGLRVRSFSQDAATITDAWANLNPRSAPVLFRQFIKGDPSDALSLFGSLGLITPTLTADAARRRAYVAVFRAATLAMLITGTAFADVAEIWGFKGSLVKHSRWKETEVWLLHGLGDILHIDSFLDYAGGTSGEQGGEVRVRRALAAMSEGACMIAQELDG